MYPEYSRNIKSSPPFVLSIGEIDGQNRETYEIERSVSNMQNDMIKLNTLLHKEKGTQVMLQQENILKENDFISNLKVSFCST